jgi:hypothetical protein
MPKAKSRSTRAPHAFHARECCLLRSRRLRAELLAFDFRRAGAADQNM